MSAIKKAWVTKHDGGMVDISLQSEHVAIKGMRLKVSEIKSGEPTSLHKVTIGLLSVEDLELIMETIEAYLEGSEA
jgi:predicted transport protein